MDLAFKFSEEALLISPLKQATNESKIKKTRACVIISANEMHGLNTVIIAPMTPTCKMYPTRISLFLRNNGYIVLDQMCTVDKSRLVKLLEKIEKKLITFSQYCKKCSRGLFIKNNTT